MPPALPHHRFSVSRTLPLLAPFTPLPRHPKSFRRPSPSHLLLLLLLLFLLPRLHRSPPLTPPPIPPSRPHRARLATRNLTVAILFHNEYASLTAASSTWLSHGLPSLASELLLFLNGLSSPAPVLARLPSLLPLVRANKLRLIPSPENLPLGLAIAALVSAARSDYVLLLEKDWHLLPDLPTTQSRILDSLVLLDTGLAHVVRHRHRHHPGVPLHARIMHETRETSILEQQKNLLCFVHHWLPDPPAVYPSRGLMWPCGKGSPAAAAASADLDEPNIFCATSEFCQWTNNPVLFKRQWFIDEVGDEFVKQYKIEKDKEGPDSPFLDFEYYTNWRSYAWTDKNFTVALGTGLFKHVEEGEHTNLNTFWYAHYRFTVDLEEIRNAYLTNETQFKSLGGVHYPPDGPKPRTMMERYPVEFVRENHWKDTFTGTIEDQRKMIDKHYLPYLKRYRILTAEEWKQTGPRSNKANMRVDWRGLITTLHRTVEKARMIAPPQQPHEMSITLVTSLLDIGRNKLGEDGYHFRRDFKMYLDAMADWLTHIYPKVVYTTQQIADELETTMSEDTKASTKFVITSREELRTKWIGPDNYDKIQTIRTSKEWLDRASWLANSPQAGLNDYNPLVMGKLFMMRHAARENYWDTSHFLFIDAKHNCRQPKKFTPKNDHIVRAHMFDKFLMTHFDYTPSTEVHGFEYEAFNQYCNKKDAATRQLVKVGRGGIFGGSAFVLEYITAMYDIALTATLREGLMGTEENIFSILFYQVPQYVDAFSNNWACPDIIAHDHSCMDKEDQGYNCAIFEWVARDAVEDI